VVSGMPWNLSNPFNMGDFVRSWARWEPDRVAVRQGGMAITWAQLDQRSNAAAARLAALGVRKLDRVAGLLTNSPEYLDVVIACMKLGAVFVPLNVRLAGSEVRQQVGHSGARVVVTDSALYPTLASIRAELSDVLLVRTGASALPAGVVSFTEETPVPAPDPLVETGPDDPLFICYTSGTTGLPKGAVLTHRNALQPALNQILIHEVSKSDRLFLPFPLAFTGGLLSNAMLAYVSGAELVLEAAFDPATALRILTEQRITVFMAVPVIWQAIAGLEEFAAADLSALRVAKSGGAPVPEPLLRTYQQKGVGMVQGYALTEGSGITTTLHERDALAKLGFAGIPTNGTRLRVVGEDGDDCEPEQVGEICVRGPEVMLGYWEDPDATAATIVDGWLHTGDSGYLDRDGQLKVVDRKKDMLISGGLNVYPVEIEHVIERFPGVGEVAVIGVPDERWGEVPAVLLGPVADPIDHTELVRFCRGELADYKTPKYVVQLEEPLPRTMSGKVLKRELAARFRDIPERFSPIRAKRQPDPSPPIRSVN